uniref:Uncharacterized protein n=1 Tax=Arundo donax TaxID=35708 RepID=A0A0A9HVD3_ARUDO
MGIVLQHELQVLQNYKLVASFSWSDN